MTGVLGPLDFVLIALAGWINERLQLTLEYVLTENRVFKQQQGRKCLRLMDEQRRLLAVKGRALGRKVLNEVATDTIMNQITCAAGPGQHW